MLRRIFILATVLAAVPAFGTLITSGYATDIVYRECDTTTCGSISGPSSLFYADFSQSGSSIQIGNDSTTRPVDFQSVRYSGAYLGSGNAVAQATGDIFAPVLKASIATEAPSVANPKGSIASSQAVIVQRYVNTGSTPIKVGLNASIDWKVDNLQPETGAFPFGIGYQVQVFEPTSGFIDIDLTSDITASLGLLGLFAAAQPVSYYNSGSGASVSGSDLLSFRAQTLDPGKGFFVATRLVVTAGTGMSVNAFNTMTGTFVDEFGKELDGSGAFQAVKVPEPGTLSLFGAGLLALGFLRRRRTA